MGGGNSKAKKASGAKASNLGAGKASGGGGGKSSFADNYKVTKELGKGNYAVVKLATDVKSGAKCAVKVVDKRKLTPEDRDALQIEIAILREMSHPNIIKMFASYDEAKELYIVLELMEGKELFDRIVKKESYSERDAVKVIKVIGAALKYMHANDVVHRDLKPENILLKDNTDDAVIKIADFGFARHVKQGCTTACGTPGYVAPEVISGKIYGVQADVWSFGVIIFILLCGYPPFYHQNHQQLFKLIKAGKVVFESPYWDPISDKAKDLVLKCLTVDAQKRLTIDQVLQHEWVTGEQGTKDISPTLGNLKLFNARRKLRAALIAAIAADKMNEIMKSFKKA